MIAKSTSLPVDKIRNVAAAATRNARLSALKRGNYVTFLSGNKILREYPDGRVETIQVLQEPVVSTKNNGELRIP